MEELNKIAAERAVEVHIFYFKYDLVWTINIEREDEGVKLKVTATGPKIEDAVVDALEKWARITGKISEFKGPLLEHKTVEANFPPNETPHMDFNDEIPY